MAKNYIKNIIIGGSIILVLSVIIYVIFKNKTKENFQAPTRKTPAKCTGENEINIGTKCKNINNLNITCNNSENNPNKIIKGNLGNTVKNLKIWNPPSKTDTKADRRSNPFVSNNCVLANNYTCKAIGDSIPKWNKNLWSSSSSMCVVGSNEECSKIDVDKPIYDLSKNKCMPCESDSEMYSFEDNKCLPNSNENCAKKYPEYSKKNIKFKLNEKTKKCDALCRDNFTLVANKDLNNYDKICNTRVRCSSTYTNIEDETYNPNIISGPGNCKWKCSNNQILTYAKKDDCNITKKKEEPCRGPSDCKNGLCTSEKKCYINAGDCENDDTIHYLKENSLVNSSFKDVEMRHQKWTKDPDNHYNGQRKDPNKLAAGTYSDDRNCCIGTSTKIEAGATEISESEKKKIVTRCNRGQGTQNASNYCQHRLDCREKKKGMDHECKDNLCSRK